MARAAWAALAVVALLAGPASGRGVDPAENPAGSTVPVTWAPYFIDHDAVALSVPLLRWDLLTTTVYDPRRPIAWPSAIERMNGTRVRMEGYLMPRYESQDPEDLFLTGVNPVNLFCGPTDLTQIVEMHMPGFAYDLWPYLPVQVVGTFHLSRNTSDFRPIYLFRGESWKPLKRFEQKFPGVALPEGQDPSEIEGP